MSIQEHLNKIRNAIYGREVRESIAKGIETAYDDASEKDNANMEVKIARGTHPNLRSRLDEVDDKHQQSTAQLAQTAKKDEVRENTSIRPINVTEMDTETKQLFTGGSVAVVGENSVGNENLKPKAVDEINASFIKIGKNKFDGKFEDLQIVGTHDRADTMGLQRSSIGGKTAVVRIEPNKTYTIKNFTGGNRFRVGVFNRKISPTSSPVIFDRRLYHPEKEGDIEEQEFTFTNDGNGVFLYIYVGTRDIDESFKLQVEEGSESTEFEDYQSRLSDNIRVDVSKGDLSERLLFEMAFHRKFINDIWETGTIHGSTGIEAEGSSRVRTRFIEMHSGQKIKTFELGELEGFYPHIYDLKDKSFIGTSGEYLTEYTVEYDCYIRLVAKFTDDRRINTISYFDDKFYIEEPSNQSVQTKSNKPILFGDFTTPYKTTEIEGVSTGDTFDLGATVIEDIYDEIDGLMNDFPDLMTKKIEGYASDSNGDEDTNLPIYEYTFTPPTTDSKSATRPVKTLLITGLHGEEKSTVWSTLQFFKQMLNDWKTNDSLASIKANMEIHWIPIANPYGFNNHNRLNARGVDPNRNFSNKWEEESATTKGTHPYSEVETRLLRDWMVENNDADFFIDFHNFSMEKPNLSYIDTASPQLMNVYSSLIRRLSDMWRRDYTLDNDNDLYGLFVSDDRPMTFREAYHVAEIELSAIIEITMFWNGVKYTKEVMEMGADLIGNYFLALLNAYDRIG